MRTLVLSLVLALPAALAAQSSFLVPSFLPGPGGGSTATTEGNNYDSFSFWDGGTSPRQPVVSQMIWDATDIPVPAAVLTSISFRRSNYVGNQNPQATAAITLELSVGPNDSTTRSSTLTANQGTLTTVFSGNINLPAESKGTGPAPFNIVIPFTATFPYVSALGKSLVADLVTTTYTPMASGTWYADAVALDAGLRVTNHYSSNCKFSNGKVNNAIGHRNPVINNTWVVNYQGGGLPLGMPAVGFLGFTGAGGNWGGLQLPFDLTALGAPGCALATSVAMSMPLTESSPGLYTWPNVPIPNDPSLIGGSFYDQGLFVDLPANSLGVVMSWSSKWTIRSGATAPAVRLYQYNNNGNRVPSPTTGNITTTATIARFTY